VTALWLAMAILDGVAVVGILGLFAYLTLF
jgi:hypothetical protein